MGRKALDRTISRQRRWQLRKRDSGFCITCGAKATIREKCLKCYDKQREQHKAYHEKHRKVLIKQMTVWRRKHPTYMKEWLKKHPDYMRNYMKAYRAKHPDY